MRDRDARRGMYMILNETVIEIKEITRMFNI